MANNLKTSIVSRNAELDALAALANSGKLRIYDGAQPATPETAVSGQNLLAELTMNATAFGAAASGVITAAAITSDTDADATGTAAWYRLLKSDGTTVLWDGSVGTSGCDLNLNSVAIQQHAQVSVSSFTYTLPQ
jgi:hypothetical protein